MAVCGLRTLLLIVCVIELIVTVQRQVFDFLGYMWLNIIVNFVNILLIIFGSFGAVQYVTKYLVAYALWSILWCTWNIFLICYYLNLGTLNRESGLLSLGTGSVSWWEGNGWGCQPVWGEVDGEDPWRPSRVEGCFFQWHHVEIGQSALAATFTLLAMPLSILLAHRSLKKRKPPSDKGTLSRRPVYTVELSTAETNLSESSLKPMTPRRVKRRSGSRGGSSRRSRRSYRNAGYIASNASLPRDAGVSRPTSAHSSYSNFHGTRPASYHTADREGTLRSQMESAIESPPPIETVSINTTRHDTIRHAAANPGYDVVGPYDEVRGYEAPRAYDSSVRMYDKLSRDYDTTSYDRVETGVGAGAGWEAPPYSAHATPQAPGPPAYHSSDTYGTTYNHNMS